MLGKLLSKIVGDPNEKVLQRLEPMVAAINALEPKYQGMHDDDLSAVTYELRQRFASGESIDDVLPDAFAAVREASKRVLGMRPFDVQLMGAITLHEGKIAEMRTGEGKTLVATLPAYLSAVAGQQVHVVTVNDYLAKRDAAWMGAVYSFMGLTIGCIQQDGVSLLYDELHTSGDSPDDGQDATGKFALNPDRHLKVAASRSDVYKCDIVYGTNNEFGFDYLRGNIALSMDDRHQRVRHFAIVDEVDNILIDEARTPLIISGPSVDRGRDYNRYATLGARLVPGQDFEIDEQRKSISITEVGIDKAEKQLGLKDIYSESTDPEIPHLLENAIRAQYLYKRDREYVVRDDQEVVLVDEFTGRLMEGRRLSDGLHQAIEAKEKLRVREETSTYATITLQNYFRLYDRLSGMTGTASTEAEELLKIYGLEVTTIPTNREDRRIDHPDLIYMTEDAKWRALADKIQGLHEDGRPILVGTTTIEKSQIISDILKNLGIKHQVLNAHASRHQSESEIIAQAGVAGTVTVATNMAGRGTDIILGGNPELVVSQPAALPESRGRKRKKGGTKQLAKGNVDGDSSTELAVAADANPEELWQAQHDSVVAGGGLFVLGTERHESRRIDNQLRGRAARQGDPGETQFFLSAEDDLVRRFGGDKIKGALGMFKWDENVPVENAMLVKSVENAQQKVEGINFEIRKQLVEYDDVANTQRAVVYELRDRILSGADFRDEILGYIKDSMSRAVAMRLEGDPTQWDIRGLQADIRLHFPIVNVLTSESDFEDRSQREIESELHDYASRTYDQRVLEFSDETMKTLERSIMLRVLDRAWVSHLTRMENMRQGIGLQAIGQRDPLVQYRAMSFQLYEQMNQEIRDEVARTILNIAPGIEMMSGQSRNGQLTANQSDGRALAQRMALAQAVSQQSVMAGAQQQQRRSSSGNGAPVRAQDGRRLSRRERRSMEREQKRRAKAGG